MLDWHSCQICYCLEIKLLLLLLLIKRLGYFCAFTAKCREFSETIICLKI